MRPIVTFGIALIIGGLFVIFQEVPYTSERQVMKFGDVEATVQERHTVPAWIGIFSVVGGVVLLAAGLSPPAPRGHHPHARGHR
ncbi:MAG TPA: hypothetical protein VJW75_00440 [Candidatus Eisenbacteria bacterium]|nr:hypothetical protein [Candidatus Eisenbacteria bacterium]